MITRRALLRAAAALPLVGASIAAAAPSRSTVALGDSLSSDPNGYIAAVAAERAYPLVILAINGSALRDQAATWRDAPSGVAVSLCGYNDMRRYGADEATLAHYEVLLTGAAWLLMKRGPVWLGGCLRMPQAGYSQPGLAMGSDAAAAAYSAVVERVCRRTGAVYVSMDGYDPDTMTGADLSHPTRAGHAWIADQFIAAMRRVYLPALEVPE